MFNTRLRWPVLCATALLVLVYHVYSSPTLNRLRLGPINFLHTTDTHGWLGGHRNQPTYDADWGDFVAFAQHLKRCAHRRNQDLLLVDSGDRHDGNGLSDATHPAGKASNRIFAAQHYDIITLGNHELYQWENSQQELESLVPHYGASYVCSNVEALVNGSYVPFGSRFRYFETPVQKARVLSFAFLFDFAGANNKTRVTPIEAAVSESWFLDVLHQYGPDAVDLVVVVGHIPISHQWAELSVLHRVLRARYPDTVIQYFGGHSHIRDFSVLDDRSTALQSGRFCETLGFLSVDLSPGLALRDRFFRAYLDFSSASFAFHAGTHAMTRAGASVKSQLRVLRQKLGLDAVVGYVSSSYYMDYVPLHHPNNIYRMLTEKVLPTLEASNSSAVGSHQRIILINTGSVRYDLYKGPYTVDTHYIVSPFENDWVKMTLPKSVAVKIAAKLNDKGYIVSSKMPRLAPAHASSQSARHEPKLSVSSVFETMSRAMASSLPWPLQALFAPFSTRLSKGYVTHDDFGSDGDDTPHRAVVNYPIPNVVQSLELTPGDESSVDVVFYSFLISSVTWAVKELGAEVPPLDFYSDNYLGQLLSQFVASKKL